MFLNTQVFGSKFRQLQAGFPGRFKLLHLTSVKHQLMGVKQELFKTPNCSKWSETAHKSQPWI